MDYPSLVIASASALLSLSTLIFQRHTSWAIRYYERWHDLEKVVMEDPDSLIHLWCSESAFKQYFPSRSGAEEPITTKELLFAEMFLDFVVEIRRRYWFLSFLSGRPPGTVELSNPRIQHIWVNHLRPTFDSRDQIIINKAIADKPTFMPISNSAKLQLMQNLLTNPD